MSLGLSVIENILALNLTPTLMFMVGVGLSGKETNTLTPKLTLLLHGGCGFECEKIRFYI